MSDYDFKQYFKTVVVMLEKKNENVVHCYPFTLNFEIKYNEESTNNVIRSQIS